MTFAFIFSDVGFGEWFVLLAVILVVVGPKRLPETARKFGNWYSKFRRAADSFKRQLMDMDTEFERAVSEAERQTSEAFAVEDEVKATGEGEQGNDPAVQPPTSNLQPEVHSDGPHTES